MIAPPGWAGVAFSDAADGDVRHDILARKRLSRSLGISSNWGTVNQVHGIGVVQADAPGNWGEADAIWTSTLEVPIAIFTADCFAVVVIADAAVGIAHAGWRGAAAGVVGELFDAMATAGHEPRTAAIGPGIGACCFEVGPEVLQRFPGHGSITDWGSQSVDLAGEIMGQTPLEEVWLAANCTKHEDRWFSYRNNRTEERMAALAWL